MRVSLQPAFVLHQRPYRETSVILDLFTLDYGRIAAVARGVRQRNSRLRALLQPFTPLVVSWQGKGEMVTLITTEAQGHPQRLMGNCLLSGLYLNELLMRVLQKHDPHPQLYTIYQNTLLELQGSHLKQKTLRLFEMRLLEELGYGLQLKQEATREHALLPEKYYRYHSEHGFELCLDACAGMVSVYSGKSLLALAAENLDDEESLRDAKRLMRQVLTPLLGAHKINSRQLFILKEEEEVKSQ